MTTLKLVCENCNQIYTLHDIAGFVNKTFTLRKSSEVINNNEVLFHSEGSSHKRVCGNCYESTFKIYF